MSLLFLRVATLAVASLPLIVTAAPLTLETALQLAVERSDASRAARAGVQSATEMSHAAEQLPDPVLRVGVDNLPFTGPDRLSSTRDSMTMKRIGISQEWLSAEKRVARQAAAQAAIGRETAQAKASMANTRLQTALAYVDAYYAGESLRLATLIEQHVREELEASRARLASAAGSSQETLALTGARGTAEDVSADIRQQQAVAMLALQRWIGRAPDELAPVAAESFLTQERYLAGHPTLVVMQQDLELATQSAAVATTNRRPNWTWEVAYGQRTGYSDMVSLGVSIPLPVSPGERQDRETTAKLALVEKADAELAEARRAALAEYQALRSDAQRLQQRIERYQSNVVTPAGQRTGVVISAYRSNQATLTTVFEARHAEVEAQQKLLALQRDLARAQAQLAFRSITTEVAP